MSINSKLSVAIIPIDIIDGDKSANIKSMTDAMAMLPEGVDMVVLPELFSTGFTNDADTAGSWAEQSDGPTMTAVKDLAAKYKAAVCGSFLAADGDKLFNRGFIVEPDGETAYYDKRHLFCLSEESKIMTPGDRLPPVVRFRGWNICMAICYDLRFPVWLRNPKLKYDVMAIPANWPESRAYAWTHLLQARAIENASYVIGADRSGEDIFGRYDGMSQVYDFLGQPIGQTSCNGQIVLATLDKEGLNHQRERFPAWCDGDDFKLLARKQ